MNETGTASVGDGFAEGQAGTEGSGACPAAPDTADLSRGAPGRLA